MALPHDQKRYKETPFHSRVVKACETNHWEDWKGYTTPAVYTDAELEYFAIRNSTSVFDLTPMTKYRIYGPDALKYLDRLVTRSLKKLAVGRVMYVVWCDDEGQVLDDGTIFRLSETEFRLCAQERHLDWLHWSAMGFDVEIADETDEVAALSLQGPSSCALLKRMGLQEVDQLRPFDLKYFSAGGAQMMVSRTGFTGDLGYELWVEPDQAERLWDRVMESGQDLNVRPIGSEALQIARIEAGFIQAGQDFVPAEQAVRQGRTRSPFELGLGWLVHLGKGPFNGRAALQREKETGSSWTLVKLDVAGNKPAGSALLFDRRGNEVGMVTSAAWVPTAKRNIAFGLVQRERAKTELFAEIYYLRELKWKRVLERAIPVSGPIYNPERRLATPAPDS